jgi:hypothetical protein
MMQATNRKQSNSTEDLKAQSEREEKIAAARARRAMKDDIPVDSESATSGLLSPRDKVMNFDAVHVVQSWTCRSRDNFVSRGRH